MVLMAEAREISGPELKERYQVRLERPNREKLNNLGYIKSWKVGQAFVHELDDKGWDRVHQGLNFDSPRSRALGAALSALFVFFWVRVLVFGVFCWFGVLFVCS